MISGRAKLAGDGDPGTSHRPGRRVSTRRWARPSPWLWGLVVLLAVAGTAVTQGPRLRTAYAAGKHRPAPAAPAVPISSGPAYTPAMVADRNFTGADLNGARLVRLDLRGKDFQDASAAGAIFAGSFLNGANLSHDNLRGADFRSACLRGANLTGAQMAGADFTGADVTGATVTPGALFDTIGWPLLRNSLV